MKPVLIGVCLAITLTSPLIGQASPPETSKPLERELSEGLLDEEVKQDLNAAMGHYKAVLAEFEPGRHYAATALLHLAECYFKQDEEEEAVASLQRLLREFGDLEDIANAARERLRVKGLRIEPPPSERLSSQDQVEANALWEARKLLSASPDLLNARDENGSTPLHRAVLKNHLKVLQFLIDEGADVNRASTVDDTELPETETPLHTAARLGHLTAAILLLERGAAVDALSSWKSTPLHYALVFKRAELARLLLDRGADPNHIAQVYLTGFPPILSAIDGTAQLAAKNDIDGKLIYHLSAFQVACLNNAPYKTLESLLKSGAEPARPFAEGEDRPIHLAANRQQSDILRLLVDMGADPNAAGLKGRRPIHLSAAPEILEILLEFEADLESLTDDGETALHTSLRTGDFWKTFIERGLQVEATDHRGRTALCVAAELGEEGVVEQLIDEFGADVNVFAHLKSSFESSLAITPLMYAVTNGTTSMVSLLLAKGAHIDLKDAKGRTALFHAADRNETTARLLVSQGADLFVLDDQFRLPGLGYMDGLRQQHHQAQRDFGLWLRVQDRVYRIFKRSPDLGNGPIATSAFVAEAFRKLLEPLPAGSKHALDSDDMIILESSDLSRTEIDPVAQLRDSDPTMTWGDTWIVTTDHWRETTLTDYLFTQKVRQLNKRPISVAINDQNRHYTITAPAGIKDHVYIPGKSTVPALYLREFLRVAMLDRPDIDLNQVTVVRGDGSATLTLDATHPPAAGQRVYLREQDRIVLKTRPVPVIPPTNISVRRDYPFFHFPVWEEKAHHVLPNMATFLAAAFSHPQFFLDHPDFSAIRIQRGDTSIPVNLSEAFDDQDLELPTLALGDRVVLPQLKNGKPEQWEAFLKWLGDQLRGPITISTKNVADRRLEIYPRITLPLEDDGVLIRRGARNLSLQSVLRDFNYEQPTYDLSHVTLTRNSKTHTLDVTTRPGPGITPGDRLDVNMQNQAPFPGVTESGDQ